MVLVLTEGFETYNANADILVSGKWSSGSLILATGAATGIRSNENAGTLTKTLDPADESATVIVGLALLCSTAIVVGDIVSFLGDDGGTEHTVIRVTSSGQIVIDRGSTQVAISAINQVVADGTWRYFEIVTVLSDTVGTVDVYLNGNSTPIVSFSGDTKNAGTDAVYDTVILTLGGGGSGTLKNDDIYILTGAGAAPTARLGQIKCWPLAPNGNGNSSQLVGSDGNSTDNYLLVDEVLSAVNSSDYNGSATDGQKDTYTYANLTPTTGSVVNVVVASYALKSDAGAKSARPVIRHAGADNGGTDINLSTSLQRSCQHYPLNPGTGVAWTIADVNAAEFGYEVRP